MINDYFINHYRSMRFPFSLYHKPLEKHLTRFLNNIATQKKDAHVLVIGGGLMHELANIPSSFKLTVIDIDPRVIEAIKKLHSPNIKEVRLVNPTDTPAILNQTFDAIYAKEVIEHIISWQAYLKGIKKALAPHGQLWLSTPNYGEPWLPFIEKTILEIIARRSGYSRKHIHPSPFSAQTLKTGLLDAGFEEVNVKPIAFRLALIATAKNSRISS